MNEPATPLSSLRVGDAAIVSAVRCATPIARRLMEMGVLRGTEVHVVRIAPLGDPMQLLVRGYYLVVRHREAAQIMVVDVRPKKGATP